ncbi:HNH endonuclease [Paraburkholderia hospita]|nr:HNH endonuclease [Paraburkholderia hospita]
MITLVQLTKHRESFEGFLNERGAEILQPTNEWELLRFRTSHGVSIIYCNKKDGLTLTGKAAEAWEAFRGAKSWRANTVANHVKKAAPIVRKLLNRDGPACFFCHLPTTDNDRSIEHLVPRTHGGPNHSSNFVLAHRACNSKVGHLSAVEKIRLREKNFKALELL